MGRVKVRFFAGLRDVAGCSSDAFDIAGEADISSLLKLVTAKYPALADVLEKRRVFISLNQEMAVTDDKVGDGDEVAFLPPFSGGL